MEFIKEIVVFLAFTWLICLAIGWVVAMFVYNYGQEFSNEEEISGFILVTPSLRTILVAPIFCLSMCLVFVSCIYIHIRQCIRGED